MIVILGFALGALWGWFLASRRNGNTLDRLQYATAYGIAFAIAGLVLTVILERVV